LRRFLAKKNFIQKILRHREIHCLNFFTPRYIAIPTLYQYIQKELGQSVTVYSKEAWAKSNIRKKSFCKHYDFIYGQTFRTSDTKSIPK